MAASYRAAMVEQVGELERENARLKQRVDSIQGRPATQRELLEMEATRVRFDDAFRDLSLGGAPAPLRNEKVPLKRETKPPVFRLNWDMKRRRRRRFHIRFGSVDMLCAVALLAVMVASVVRWPDKILADIAIPTAILIAFAIWRERR